MSDHKERESESLGMKLLLQQQPVARDLRTISSALKMISDLERIGAQASDIAGITGYIEDEQLKSGTHIYEMARAASRMVTDSVDSFVRKDLGKARAVQKEDDIVDGLFDTVNIELVGQITEHPDLSGECLDLLMIAKYLERIGDHAMNICEYTNMIKEKQITFSKEVIVQIEQMKEVCCDALDLLLDNQANSESLHSIESIEQKIDDMTESFRKGQIDRMQTGKCSDEGCVLYSEMLTDFERIGDHILNIGQEVTGSVDD